MKILIVVPSYPRYSGVDFHRMVQPHNIMGTLFEDMDISQVNEIDSLEPDFLSQFDLVVANRFISKTGNVKGVVDKLNSIGLKYVLDLDDDYKLPAWHLLHDAAKQANHTEQIVLGIKNAYAITTTHELIGAAIRSELGQKNVYIVPNGIYPEGQFEVRPADFDRLHFGWSGSITHFDDVLLVHDALASLYQDETINNQFRMVYGGYDGTDTTSQAIAGVLTCKGKAKKDNFIIYPARDVVGYAEFYDHINVALIPLRNNRFNNMKSNLKLLEAGFKRKAVIVSDVYPYTPMLEHGKNCLVVKHRNDWYKHMRRLIENPTLVDDLASQLYDDVQDYHMERIAEVRYKTYLNL